MNRDFDSLEVPVIFSRGIAGLHLINPNARFFALRDPKEIRIMVCDAKPNHLIVEESVLGGSVLLKMLEVIMQWREYLPAGGGGWHDEKFFSALLKDVLPQAYKTFDDQRAMAARHCLVDDDMRAFFATFERVTVITRDLAFFLQASLAAQNLMGQGLRVVGAEFDTHSLTDASADLYRVWPDSIPTPENMGRRVLETCDEIFPEKTIILTPPSSEFSSLWALGRWRAVMPTRQIPSARITTQQDWSMITCACSDIEALGDVLYGLSRTWEGEKRAEALFL